MSAEGLGSRQYPTVFVVGMPKCGTTSLVADLHKHPEISVSEPKEPCLFALDDPDLNPFPFFESPEKMLSDLETIDYESLLAARTDVCFNQGRGRPTAVRVDGTPGYIMSRTARVRIQNHVPDAKFIVLLRDPSKRLVSAYWHGVRHGRVSSSFASWLQKEGLRDLNVGMYFDNLRDWYRDFPASSFLVRTSAEYANNRQGVLRDVFQHIEVSVDSYDYEAPHQEQNVTPYPWWIAARLRSNAIIQIFSKSRRTTSVFNEQARKLTVRGHADKYALALSSRIGRSFESSKVQRPVFGGEDQAVFENVQRLYKLRNAGLDELLGRPILEQWNMA